MLPCSTQGLFSGKNCLAAVINPRTIEEKGFLSSSTYLGFEVLISGDVSSQVVRKDQDFADLHSYLELLFPHVMVPPLPPPQVHKQITDAYMQERAQYLARFLTFCLKSEIIKQDFLFE